MATNVPTTEADFLTGWRAWLSALVAMSRKELTIMLRYPVELVSSFGQVFLIVVVLTLAGLTFSKGGIGAGSNDSGTAGLVVYGFILFIFLNDTLWNIGYNVRREQMQGTLEQLYLSPASKFASLLSRVSVTLIWTGALSIGSAAIMSVMIGRLPFENLPLGALVLVLALSGPEGAA